MFGYVSTRGKALRLGFADAALEGLATDGGLYVPELCPKISDVEFSNMAHQSYIEVAWRVILPFVADDIPSGDLLKILQASWRRFDSKEIAPIHSLSGNFHVLELFHGPTFAFKDLALQFLGQIFDYLLEKRQGRVTIAAATSGDTGSAAIEAFRGKKNADIFILHPHGRVSDVQRRQMTTVLDDNVFNVAVEGSFDDCQDIVKGLFNDEPFRREVNLSAVNSINWARILAQVVYYVYAAARLKAAPERPLTFSVPTGNFGNIYAGYVAKNMGVPIDRLLAATNRNDILYRFFKTGRMEATRVIPTLSPSMDIQISSNFERLLFDMLGRSGDAVTQTMAHFRTAGPFDMDAQIMEKVRKTFDSGHKDDAQTLEVMRIVQQKSHYLLDPHSAVGVAVAEDYQRLNPKSVMVSLATAHPAKFPAAVRRATGMDPPVPPLLYGLEQKPEKFQILPPDLDRVRDYMRQGLKK